MNPSYRAAQAWASIRVSGPVHRRVTSSDRAVSDSRVGSPSSQVEVPPCGPSANSSNSVGARPLRERVAARKTGSEGFQNRPAEAETFEKDRVSRVVAQSSPDSAPGGLVSRPSSSALSSRVSSRSPASTPPWPNSKRCRVKAPSSLISTTGMKASSPMASKLRVSPWIPKALWRSAEPRMTNSRRPSVPLDRKRVPTAPASTSISACS